MKTFRKLPKNINLQDLIKQQDGFFWQGDVLTLLDSIKEKQIFDLVVTSPPYNIGKSYESIQDMDKYFLFQEQVIKGIDINLKSTGAICWQVRLHFLKRWNTAFVFRNPAISNWDFGCSA